MTWDGRPQRCSIKTGQTGLDDGLNESDRTHAQVRNKMPGTSPLSRWRMSNRLKVQRAIDNSRRGPPRSIAANQYQERSHRLTSMFGLGDMSRMVLSFLERPSYLPGHHVNAIPRLDREPVKAGRPEWGRGEAESLDR